MIKIFEENYKSKSDVGETEPYGPIEMLSNYDIDLFSLTPVKLRDEMNKSCRNFQSNHFENKTIMMPITDSLFLWPIFNVSFKSHRLVYFLARFVIRTVFNSFLNERKRKKRTKLLYPYGLYSSSIESER